MNIQKLLIILYLLQILLETYCQQEIIEEINDEVSEDEQAIIEEGPKFILKLELNEQTNEIYTVTHIGSPPIQRKMKVKVEGNVTYVKCYDCQTDELNLLEKYNSKNKYPLNNYNCSSVLDSYYEIQSSDTGHIYNCLQKQYRQQHNCDHCGKTHRCEYNYTYPDGSIEAGYYAEDYFLLNENLNLTDFHYVQLNEARTRFPLVCLYNYTDNIYQGEIGLGDNRRDRGKWMNFVDDLSYKKQNLSNTFDFCLHSRMVQYSDEIGFIMFGQDSIQNKQDFEILYDKNTDGLYYSNFTQITVNENQSEFTDVTAIFSTGHAEFRAPYSVIEYIQQEVKNHILSLQEFYGKLYTERDILCFQKHSQVENLLFFSQFPDLNLHFSQSNLNQNITWKSKHYLIQQLQKDPDTYCMALEFLEKEQNVQILTKDKHNRQVTTDIGQRRIIELGYKILEGNRVQFDRKNQKIYFKDGNCIFAETAKDFVFVNKYNPDEAFYALVSLLGILALSLGIYLGV
ncbi:Aspartic peptidase domain [Pseudocohnilembus persalinus]|uniref:Aspartic peptidase domain n=1 Tax=Pseudocohnilembus persalinus TaxID=266149 RepID=A0A0V0QNS3_PSEPJ|nr:Aspartic peptidase domain [Pseudocohnilembus persalinus]|eukprot:KRX03922.1 Aspartic peptidase domain [Pseudocohnilembus persalinus]